MQGRYIFGGRRSVQRALEQNECLQVHGSKWDVPVSAEVLTAVIVKPLSTVFAQSSHLKEVPKAWRKASVTSIFRKGKKEGTTV